VDNLKSLYYRYQNSEDYGELGQMPETIKAETACLDFLKEHFPGSSYLPVEELIVMLGSVNEMQGFVYGFRYAMLLIGDCRKAVTVQ